jgi:hypothetical protein
MKSIIAASAVALLLTAASVTRTEAGQVVSPQECDALWKEANPSNVEKLPEANAASYISDMKAVNPDGDGTIEKNEFSDACAKGLVKSASAGTKQPAANETSDRTPEKKTPTPASQVDTDDGKTSDRTPEK